MKKFITLLLSFILILTASVPPVFADEFYTSSNDQILTVAEFERLFPSDYTYSTYYEDATGNNGYIKFDIINNKTYVELYINNILSQRAYSSPDENIIRWIEYDAQSRSSNSALIQSCLYSDMITDITFQNVENNSYELYSSIFSPEGWNFLMNRPSNAMISGSKPCSIYSKNYDDEPDQNRYSGKQIKAGVGTAVSVIVSLVATFITGGVTVNTIIVSLGSAILSDVITSAISGNVCFSTQKIRYAPVIDGMNIFPDAYITKRWVIISDTVHRTESIKLDNAEYQYNRGHDAYAIAANAQQAEVDSRH